MTNKQAKREKKYNFLAINNVDMPGKQFNGYDLMEYINKNTTNHMNQIVNCKRSNNKNVIGLYEKIDFRPENFLASFEKNTLSVHSCLSYSTPALLKSDVFKKSDLLHFHLIHNSKLSLFSLIEMSSKKPTIISIHDPWIFTGRCVHFEECNKYLTGCHNCQRLDSLFPLAKDNCDELWKLKKMVYDNINADFVVSSKYMLDLFNSSPLTKGKRVHMIPLGVDLNKFKPNLDIKKARDHYNISSDAIVIFHRAQRSFKGTNYFCEALEKLDTKKEIVIITCSEKGLLDNVKNKFKVLDLGEIDTKELKYAYSACNMFVMPSIGESFGMMAVEAMACSKPVIVFNNTSLPTVTFAPECGVLVNNKDSNDLMLKIKWLIDDEKERIIRGKRGREICEEHYDINKYYKRMEKLYIDVVERNRENKPKLVLSDIKSAEDTEKLKWMLNKLTKQVFNKHSKEYKMLIYNYDKVFNKNTKIKYGNLNVQLLIDEYNKKFYELYQNYNYINRISKFKTVLSKKVKRFIYLLLHDRKKLIQTIIIKLRR